MIKVSVIIPVYNVEKYLDECLKSIINQSLKDIEIICINCMEDKNTVDQFIKDQGYTFNVGYDTDGRIEAYYPTDGIPYTLVINKGKIYRIYVGANGADEQYQEYKKAIDECAAK